MFGTLAVTECDSDREDLGLGLRSAMVTNTEPRNSKSTKSSQKKHHSSIESMHTKMDLAGIKSFHLEKPYLHYESIRSGKVS